MRLQHIDSWCDCQNQINFTQLSTLQVFLRAITHAKLKMRHCQQVNALLGQAVVKLQSNKHYLSTMNASVTADNQRLQLSRDILHTNNQRLQGQCFLLSLTIQHLSSECDVVKTTAREVRSCAYSEFLCTCHSNPTESRCESLIICTIPAHSIGHEGI
jgi:hypothetical protein